MHAGSCSRYAAYLGWSILDYSYRKFRMNRVEIAYPEKNLGLPFLYEVLIMHVCMCEHEAGTRQG